MNKKYPKLDPAPVVEAVFCVDLAGLPPLKPDRIPDLMKMIDDGYAKESDILVKSLTFDMQKNGEAIAHGQQTTGMRFKKEKQHIVGLSNFDQQTVRFGYSRLRPYDSWESFVLEGKGVFERFVGSCGKLDPVVKRFGIRFVNVLPVGADECKMAELLYSVPPDPKDVSNINIEDFLYRDTAYYKDYDLMATVVRASNKDASGNLAAVFDSDIFTKPNVDVSKFDVNELLGRAHELKNALFFGGVSETWYKKFIK